MFIWRAPALTWKLHHEYTAVCPELRSSIPSQGINIDVFPISARLPNVGERLTLLGYRQTNSADISAVPNIDGFISYGTVTDIHEKGRGKMLPSTGFTVDAPCNGGMSGGPVLDRDGNVVGIISSGCTFRDGSGYSNISSILPALELPISVKWPKPERQSTKKKLFESKGINRLLKKSSH